MMLPRIVLVLHLLFAAVLVACREQTGRPVEDVDIDTLPTLRWQFDTGGIVESSPAIVDGVLYALNGAR
jgi:outer membrane protein assembly factor BamB